MSHSRTLLSTISDKANASWSGGVVTKESYPAWEAHWIDTAKQWRNELQAEGLTKTVEKMDNLIKFFEQGNGD